MAHILAELSDQQKECVQNKSSQTHFTGVCLEVEFMRRDIRLNKCKYTLPIYKAAFYYTINDLLKITIGEREYMELEYSYRNDGCQLRSIQYRKAVELGLFDNFDETLEKMAKERGHG